MSDTLKILVIDDSEDDRILYARALQKSTNAHYILIEASDGDEGLEHLKEATPDCILLDYSLPGHNGIEVLKQIRTTHAFIPVVMLTGQGNEKVAVMSMQEGAQNYIAKSTISSETLDHTIRMAIERCAMEKRIHEQHTSLEVFTRALAHDLKEPVRTIRSFIEMVQEENVPAEQKTVYFHHIEHAANRMQMLIDMVFAYTQLDTPGQTIKTECDMRRILAEAKDIVDPLIIVHKATITSDPLPFISGNQAQLVQLLQNLLSNAIRHGKKQVNVHVGATEKEDRWIFFVRDNGPGIDANYMQKIFEPFKRIVHHEEGSGLGLAICKKIIELHEGKIWCESNVGVGTTFYFSLPKTFVEASKLQATRKAVASVIPIPNDRPLANVLVVDDREADRDLIRIKLIEKPQLQCNLFMAADGETALSILRDKTTPIDLMLLDINMPEMDGFELLTHMQEEGDLEHTSVVMCTGSSYHKDKEKAESLGASGYLTKPGEFGTLKSIIERNTRFQLATGTTGYKLFRSA